MQRRNESRAFTLIEFVVVVAIIATLSGMLLPTFVSAQESARRATCLSNLKQLGLGFYVYTEDYDTVFPGRRTPITPKVANWAHALYPFVKSDKIYECPDASTPLDSYAYNWELANGMTGKAVGTPTKALISPSYTVLLFEGQGGATPAKPYDPSRSPLAGVTGDNGWEIGKSCAYPYKIGISWHDPATTQNSLTNGLNYLAADGHDRFLPVRAVSFWNGGDPSTVKEAPNNLTSGVSMTFNVRSAKF